MDPGDGTDATLTHGAAARAAAPGAATLDDLPIGDPEQYHLQGEHGRGGIGRVLAARDRILGRTVALKELLVDGEVERARFVREALITARLQHPGVVPVYEARRRPSGEPYYAMKLVSGRTLKELIAAARDLDGRLALLPQIIAVAETVAYAHSRRVIHRDLKPANVIVGEFGETVVIDWGLAKDLSEPADEGGVGVRAGAVDATLSGEAAGTPQYMAPEQARAEPVDERADVYALGSLLYHVLAGGPAYTGNVAQILSALTSRPPPPLRQREPAAPPELAAVVERAMARDPASRYPTARELADDLKRFQTGQLVSSHRYSAGALLRRWARRHRVPLTLSAIFIALLATVGAVSVRRIVVERRNAEAQRNALILVQARHSLETDPTASLAWIKSYPTDAADWEEARNIAVDAASRGVARQVMATPSRGLLFVALSPDGRWVLASERRGPKVHAWRAADASLEKTIELGADGVSGMTMSPDGRRVAICDASGLIKLVTLGTWEERELRGHAGLVEDLAFSPDGNLLASVGDDRTLRLWTVATGEARVFSGHQGEVSGLAFSPDGQRVATSSSQDGTVRVWDPSTGSSQILSIGRVATVAMVPPHKVVLFVYGELAGMVWDPDDGSRRLLAGHQTPVARLAASPRGWIATATREGEIRVFPPDGGESRLWRAGTLAPWTLTFSPDAARLAVASPEGLVSVWSTATGGVRTLRGHHGLVMGLGFNSDGSSLASAGEDRTVRLWPAADEGRELAGHEGIVVLGFTADGRLASGGAEGSVRVWDVAAASGRVLGIHAPARVRELAALAGEHVASFGLDQVARIWNTRTGESRALPGALSPLRLVHAVTSDGGTLAYGLEDGRVAKMAVDTGELVTLPTEGGTTTALAFSRDGRVLAAAAADKRIRLDGEVLGTTASEVRQLAYLDEIRLVSAEENGAVIVWDTRARREMARVAADKPQIAVSPDRETVAIAAGDGHMRLWRLAHGEVSELTGPRDRLEAVAFSRDGRKVAAGGVDRAAYVWDTRTGALAIGHRHGATVFRLAFAPDQDLIASSDMDGKIWVTPVVPGVLPSPEGVLGFATSMTSATTDRLPR